MLDLIDSSGFQLPARYSRVQSNYCRFLISLWLFKTIESVNPVNECHLGLINCLDSDFAISSLSPSLSSLFDQSRSNSGDRSATAPDHATFPPKLALPRLLCFAVIYCYLWVRYGTNKSVIMTRTIIGISIIGWLAHGSNCYSLEIEHRSFFAKHSRFWFTKWFPTLWPAKLMAINFGSQVLKVLIEFFPLHRSGFGGNLSRCQTSGVHCLTISHRASLVDRLTALNRCVCVCGCVGELVNPPPTITGIQFEIFDNRFRLMSLER